MSMVRVEASYMKEMMRRTDSLLLREANISPDEGSRNSHLKKYQTTVLPSKNPPKPNKKAQRHSLLESLIENGGGDTTTTEEILQQQRFPKVMHHRGTFDVKEDPERDRLRPAFLGGKYVSKIQRKSEVSQYILGLSARQNNNNLNNIQQQGRRNRTIDLTTDCIQQNYGGENSTI